ncbi:MAG: hypothetical protein V4560_13345 [Bacteroidota bacterium]
MKKLLSIICVALVVAAFASCKKTYVTNVQQTPNQTFSVTVAAASWVLTTDGKAYNVDIPVTGNYQFFNDSDVTIAELSFDTGSAKTYEPMPYVYNNVSYSYTHYVGTDKLLHVVLYSQPVGGGAVVKPTSDIIVKLVLIPSS